jgi:Trk K+ transport system NAD-binding subunit
LLSMAYQSDMRAFVIGGGPLGSHSAEGLLEDGCEVTAFDHLA